MQFLSVLRQRQDGKARGSLKRALLAAVAGIATLGSLATVAVPAAQAGGQFSCGPHFRTYEVVANGGTPGKGIRCVREYTNTIVWYGEGNWNGVTYRHVGIADAGAYGYLGSASDINGNGEGFHGSFPYGLLIKPAAWSLNTVTVYDVTGAWNESWFLVSSLNYAPLPEVSQCGSFFDRYYVTAGPGAGYANGTRCVMRTDDGNHTVWYGDGYAGGGTSYTHIGLLDYPVSQNPETRFGSAADLCGLNFGGYCGATGTDAIKFVRNGAGWTVTGAWNEIWH